MRFALQVSGVAWRMPIGPGAFGEDAPYRGIAGLGNGTGAAACAAAEFAGHQAKVSHELAGAWETSQVTDLGRHCDRGEMVDPAQGAQRLDHRVPDPKLTLGGNVAVQLVQALLLLLKGVQGAGQCNLLGRMGKLLISHPGAMHLGPLGFRPMMPVPQQQMIQLLALFLDAAFQIRPQPNQIPHRLLGSVRHPHRCQISQRREPRQLPRITTIGFDLFARLFRNQRRRHHLAAQTQIPKLTPNHKAAGTGLVDHMQRRAEFFRQRTGQLDQRIGSVRNCTAILDCRRMSP